MRMGRAHQVHRNIGIDQDHDCRSVRYPCSISASIVSISPVGNSCFAVARMISSFLPTSPTGSRQQAPGGPTRQLTYGANGLRAEFPGIPDPVELPVVV